VRATRFAMLHCHYIILLRYTWFTCIAHWFNITIYVCIALFSCIFIRPIIVKIDSVTPSFCLHHYVQNGLSYSAEETRPTLCKPMPSFQLGIRSKRTNKHQLLHRIASVKTPLIYNTNSTFEFGIQNLKNRNSKECERIRLSLLFKM